jgi:hypothetical protein
VFPITLQVHVLYKWHPTKSNIFHSVSELPDCKANNCKLSCETLLEMLQLMSALLAHKWFCTKFPLPLHMYSGNEKAHKVLTSHDKGTSYMLGHSLNPSCDKPQLYSTNKTSFQTPSWKGINGIWESGQDTCKHGCSFTVSELKFSIQKKECLLYK